MNRKQLDIFHIQIVTHYLKNKSDFLNIIQVKKQYEFLLDNLRINPIPITEETQNLFKYLDTQQIFGKRKKSTYLYDEIEEEPNEKEIILENIKILKYNFKVSYSQMKEIENKHKNEEIQLKFKRVVFTKYDSQKYGNTIPKEVTILGIHCLNNSEEKEIIIPSNVSVIRNNCFSSSSLEKIIIPDSVIFISMEAFQNYYKLSSIRLNSNIEELSDSFFENCKNLKNITLPPYLTCIESKCFKNCGIEEIEIPSTVKSIGYNCFENCTSLTKVVLNKGIQIAKLNSECFKNCGIKQIDIPSTVMSIGERCFENCSSLESIIIPSSIKFINEDLLKNCHKLKELIILNEKCQTTFSFFEGCESLTKIYIPLINDYCSFTPSESEKQILERNGIKVFNCIQKPIKREKLKSLELINDEIVLSKFDEETNYTSFYIPSTVTRLEDDCFSSFDDLNDLVLPSNIISYGSNIFHEYCYEYLKLTNERDFIKRQIRITDYQKFKEHEIHCQKVEINFDDEFSELPEDSEIVILGYNWNNKKLEEIPPNIIGIWD